VSASKHPTRDTNATAERERLLAQLAAEQAQAEAVRASDDGDEDASGWGPC